MAPLSLSGTVDGRARRRTEKGQSYQVQGRTTRQRRRRRTRDTLWPMPRIARLCALALAAAVVVGACGSGQVPSFDPTGPCSTDGRAAGAYPDLEALVPTRYRGVPPDTLDSGRNCTVTNLGALASLGISEVRFAGGTWTFGAERAAVLAVFKTKGLSAEALAAFYSQSAHAAPRTQVVAQSAPTVAGRPGRRIDTKTGSRVQTVVVWPAADDDVVNVVITNDLPDARIQDAIDAYDGR
jgi:hypothetical protein